MCVRVHAHTHASVGLYVLAFSTAVCILSSRECSFFGWKLPARVSPKPEAWQEWTKMFFIPQECGDLTVAFLCWPGFVLNRRESQWGGGSGPGPSGLPLPPHQPPWLEASTFHHHNELKVELRLELRCQPTGAETHIRVKGSSEKQKTRPPPGSL